MRTAATILGIIHERGKKGLPLEDIYRQLYNPALYLLAYSRLYKNGGAMTTGITPETVDGMSLPKIYAIIEDIRAERFRWTPVRRIHIPKSKGKTRPLGIPTWTDKLMQEVIRLILEAYYEPQFSESSHGFRPGRGCHTALSAIKHQWTGTKWFIEGDIRGCFDAIDHQVLMAVLKEKIHDNRFLRLLQHLCQAGYLEQWKYNATYSGVPQGGVISPILSNIYLHKLDEYMEKLMQECYQGEKRGVNSDYYNLGRKARRYRKRGRWQEAKLLKEAQRKLPSLDPYDPGFRRLRYIRYADDWLIGYVGTKTEAQAMKERIRAFLKEKLKLELSEEKTLITHATTQKAQFLGYAIRILQCENYHHPDLNGQRTRMGRVLLGIPKEVKTKKIKAYRDGKRPLTRTWLRHESDFTIVEQYGAEWRGFVEYYALAYNRSTLWTLHWVMKGSLLKTLATKFQCGVTVVKRKYQAQVKTPDGRAHPCLEVVVERQGKNPLVARFGGISLRTQKGAITPIEDSEVVRWNQRSELLQRLLANTCDLCGSHEHIEVHHIRKLSDLKQPGRNEKPEWMKIMIARKRKTLPVCLKCHQLIHAGKPIPEMRKPQNPTTRTSVTGEPDALKSASPVRGGADEKGQ